MCTVIFSLGYVVFDLFIILFEIKDFSDLGKQNIMHHLIAMTASLCSLMSGNLLSSAAGATVLTEVSTIVLHFRYYLIK
jgi:hypothetical protein